MMQTLIIPHDEPSSEATGYIPGSSRPLSMDIGPHRSVHIAVDALAFGHQPAGVGRYVTTLLQGLANLEPRPTVTVFARNEARSALAGNVANVVGPGSILSQGPLRALWEQLRLPAAATARGAQLLHGLMGVVPSHGDLPRVVTIHDATFFTHPQLHTTAKVLYFRLMLARAAHSSRLVITDSHASKAELIAQLDLPEQRIRVVHLCPDASFRPASAAEASALGRDRHLPERFILYAGVLEPRKNLRRLVAAVGQLRSQGWPHELVLAGKLGWRADDLVAQLGAVGYVHRLGYVSDSELRALLGRCDAFAYVPLIEGFGLPVAEAMACGAPVVTSACSSLPEVAMGAAELVDPRSPDSIAAGLRRVIGSRDRADDLRRRGFARAAELTPTRLAQETMAVYREALETRPESPPRTGRRDLHGERTAVKL